MQSPKIGIVIPVYNAEDYIEETLASVVSQTYSNWHLYLVNDASTDGSLVHLEEFKAKFKDKVTVISHSFNKGLSATRNTGIRVSKEKFIAFLDADDLWLPTKLEDQVLLLSTLPTEDDVVIYADYFIVGKSGNVTERENWDRFRPHSSESSLMRSLLVHHNFVAGSGSAVLMNRRIFEKVGFFDESLNCCEDWDLWSRASDQVSFHLVEKAVVGIRRHVASMQNDSFRMSIGKITVHVKIYERLKNTDPVLALKSIDTGYIELMQFPIFKTIIFFLLLCFSSRAKYFRKVYGVSFSPRRRFRMALGILCRGLDEKLGFSWLSHFFRAKIKMIFIRGK